MATKKNKKAAKKKNNNGNLDGAPQIIAAKGGLTAAQFLTEINSTLDEPLSRRQLRDLQVSIESVVVNELEQGNPVNLFGLVKIVPRLHTKGTRMVNEEFGNPESKKVKKSYKSKVSLKVGQGIFTKKVKDALPTVQKLQKRVAA